MQLSTQSLVTGRWLLVTSLFIVTGCAAPTALLRLPSRYTGPTVVLQHVEYMPLKLFCEALQYDCQWDRLRGVATIRGDRRAITCLVGSSAMLLNGQPAALHQPVRWYDGAVMVPRTFEQLFIAPTVRPEAARMIRRHPIRHVVIDPGHGGKDPGATGVAGMHEKAVVLDVAQRVAEQLRSAGYRVTMTRSTDTFISLPDRAEMANRTRADFFIAIHANANRNARIHGVETYYLKPTSLDLEMERAMHQAQDVVLPYDHTALNSSLDTKAIVWDLLNVEYRRQAVELGRSIALQVARQLGVHDDGTKAARFQVLRDTNMPAVLVEIGYLTNPVEGQRLAEAPYRQRLAAALTDGILAYFHDHERTDGFSQ